MDLPRARHRMDRNVEFRGRYWYPDRVASHSSTYFKGKCIRRLLTDLAIASSYFKRVGSDLRVAMFSSLYFYYLHSLSFWCYKARGLGQRTPLIVWRKNYCVYDCGQYYKFSMIVNNYIFQPIRCSCHILQ